MVKRLNVKPPELTATELQLIAGLLEHATRSLLADREKDLRWWAELFRGINQLQVAPPTDREAMLRAVVSLADREFDLLCNCEATGPLVHLLDPHGLYDLKDRDAQERWREMARAHHLCTSLRTGCSACRFDLMEAI